MPKKRVDTDIRRGITRPKETTVILRFVNRKHKLELLKQGKKLKGTNVYMNDHLTKRNAEIAKKARDLRKEKKIQHGHGQGTVRCSSNLTDLRRRPRYW